jgi:hypothetical protein
LASTKCNDTHPIDNVKKKQARQQRVGPFSSFGRLVNRLARAAASLNRNILKYESVTISEILRTGGRR